MRPCILRMTAFGPFQGCETVRFDQLGDNALFLINGPTGSGKTTLLDAICFALYGRTTGDEREGGQMRCDHAPADLLTEVEFSFSLSDAQYRIRRIPEQQRPKARGEGTTTQVAEAQLWRVSPELGDQLIVASKVTEATREIEQLTGLSVEQFRQVMVLPQGKFRELLLAESKAREAIFSQLFQTHIYQQLELRLKARAAEIRREVEKSRQIELGILEGAGLEDKQALQMGLKALIPEEEQAAKLKSTTEQNYTHQLQTLEQARQLNEAFKRLSALQAQMARLEKQRPDIQIQQQQLERAQQADQLKQAEETLTRCRTTCQQAEKKALDARRQMDEAKQASEQANNQLLKAEQLIQPLDDAKQQLATLNSYQTRAIHVDQAREALTMALADEQVLIAAQQKTAEQLQQQTDSLAANQLEQEKLQKGIAQRIEAPLAQQRLTVQIRDRQALDALLKQRAEKQQQLERAEQQGKTLVSKHAEVNDQYKRLELAWHRGQAALLARELEANQPCPVCGSESHPAPAASVESLPTEHELDQARQVVQAALDELTEARKAYGTIRGVLDNLNVQVEQKQVDLGEVLQETAAELQSRHDRLKKQVQQLKQDQQTVEQLTTAAAEIRQRETTLRAALDLVSKQLAGQQRTVATKQSGLHSAELELPEIYREAGALAAAIAQVNSTIEKYDTEIRQARELCQRLNGVWEAARATSQSADEVKRDADKARAIAEQQWDSALGESLFADEADYHKARMDTSAKAAVKHHLSEFETAVQQTAGALKQQQLLLEGKAPPDLERLSQELAQSEQAKLASEKNWQALDKRLGQLRAAEEKLNRVTQACEALEKQYAVLGTLSDVANGQTGDKISLQRFVLSVLLDDVLVEASHRLHLMTKGRYQLLRKETRSKGNRASGLELEVEDAYSGKCRPVATLSGGESFLAALSLALGMSDVVQAYSGGIRLDTLFIDEGFGSLDPESLDLAIRTLIDLQASGRMIGVISHVAELKEQMPLRLDISAGRAGSHVTLVRP